MSPRHFACLQHAFWNIYQIYSAVLHLRRRHASLSVIFFLECRTNALRNFHHNFPIRLIFFHQLMRFIYLAQ